MPYFVICGKPDCPNFAHAAFVAQYLSERLPYFFYKKIEMLPREWALFLDDLNRENKWYMTNSPVIWKEINMWGGTKYLLGGLGEFWEHVYCYYGLESLIPKCSLMELAADNLKFFKQKLDNESKRDVQIIAFLGAANLVVTFVINDFLQIKTLRKADGILFKCYDHLQAVNSEVYSILAETLTYFNENKVFGKNNLVEICDSREQVLSDADIVIHFENFSKREEEEERSWLDRCHFRMKMFADTLITHGKRTAKIIIASNGPVCFLATCLWNACLNKFPNIVAVTADKGLPYIKSVSEKTGIHVERISAPAVWGCIGLNSFVDVKNMLFKADIYRPYKSSLTAPKGSTLPLGVINSEIRLMSYKISDPTEIDKDVEEKSKQLYDIIKRPPIFSKARAIVSLIKLWYAEEVGDEIISLGVPSDGTFEISEGVVFSQPVKLDESRKWVPYANFPLMDNEAKIRIKECITATQKLLVQHELLEETELSSYGDEYERYLEGLQEIGEHESVYDFQSIKNSSLD